MITVSNISEFGGRLCYTNIAINPLGQLVPWPGVKTTPVPPVLKTDGQITWLEK